METKTETMQIGHFEYETDMPRVFKIHRHGCKAFMLVDEEKSAFVVKPGGRIIRFTDNDAFPVGAAGIGGRNRRIEHMRIWDARDALVCPIFAYLEPSPDDFFIIRQEERFACPDDAESFVTGQRPNRMWTAEDGTVPVHWRVID